MKTLFSFILAVVVLAATTILTTTTTTVAGQLQPQPGAQQSALCSVAGSQLWVFSAGAQVYGSAALFTPPALPDATGDNTVIYFGTQTLPNKDPTAYTAHFYAVKALMPDAIWQKSLLSAVVAGPAIGGPLGDSVYFGVGEDAEFYALNTGTGIQEWKFTGTARFEAQPLYTWRYGGTVFVGDSGGNFYAIETNNKAGSVRWQLTPLGSGAPIYDQAILLFAESGYDLLFVGNNDGDFYCISAIDGSGVWNKTMLGGIISSATFVPSGAATPAIAVTDNSGRVTMFDLANGTELWSTLIAGSGAQLTTAAYGLVEQQAAATTIDLLFIGSSDKNLYALHASNGSIFWQFATGGPIFSPPIVSTGRRYNRVTPAPGIMDQRQRFVYVGSNDKQIYQLDAVTGKKLWNFTTGGAIFAQPVLDTATGVLYVGSLDKNFYAILAEPTCLPACSIPTTGGKSNKMKTMDQIIVPLSASAEAQDSATNSDDDDANNNQRFQQMPGISTTWLSRVQSVVYHPASENSYAAAIGSSAASSGRGGSDESNGIDGSHYYTFFAPSKVFAADGVLDALVRATPEIELEAQAAALNTAATARGQACTWTLGCVAILPCVAPEPPKRSNLSISYTREELQVFYDSAALHGLFEFAVALVTTRNKTLAQHIFLNRASSAFQATGQDPRNSTSLLRASIIAYVADISFTCVADSAVPHVVLTSGNFSFDATAYALAVDAEVAANAPEFLGRSAVNALAGGHTFLSSCVCSSCAPYFSTDNNAIPWLFLLAACVKTVLVSFKLVPLVAAVRKYFLRRRTHGDADYSAASASSSAAKVSGTRDPVAVLRSAQELAANVRRGSNNNSNNNNTADSSAAGTTTTTAASTAGVIFYGQAEVKRRLTMCVGLEQSVGKDFVRFYLSQFSSSSSSFESSTLATPWDRETRKEKILDVVVPSDKFVQQVAAVLAPLDRIFEEVLDERYAEVGAREAESFSGKMSNLFRFSTSTAGGGGATHGYPSRASRMASSYYRGASAAPAAGAAATASGRAPLLGAGTGSSSSLTKLADNNNKQQQQQRSGGYGATNADDFGDDDQQQPAAAYDYNEQQQQQKQQQAAAAAAASSGNNNNSGSDKQQHQQGNASNNNKQLTTSGVSLREIRSAIKAFRTAIQEHPEWFEIITVVSHRLPKNPFLPSRLILALATLYAVIYWIVSLADTFLWKDQALLLTHKIGNPNTSPVSDVTRNEHWQRYEAFAWRIMNSTIFPLLFVNCLFAHFQYMLATTSETGNILKKLNNSNSNNETAADGSSSSKNNNNPNSAGGATSINTNSYDDDDDVTCWSSFKSYLDSLMQHFEGRVALLLVILCGPMILTHLIPGAAVYIWLVAPIFFFLVLTPAVVIAAMSRAIIEEQDDQQAQLNNNNSNSNGSNSRNSLNEPSALSAFCSAISLRDVSNRRRLAVYFCYCVLYFFVCTLVSWTFNVAALYLYQGDGTVHFVDPDNGRRYASAIKWEVESRSPVCATISFWWSASAAMRNLYLGLVPF